MAKKYLPVRKVQRPEQPISGVYATDRQLVASIDLATPIANAIAKAVTESAQTDNKQPTP